MSNSHHKKYQADFRPTTSKVRESLFNILYSELGDFSEYTFLDCFAGSGQVSLDASWKNFKSITCLEQNPKHISIIKNNIQKYKLNNINIQQIDLFKSNISLKNKYNIIFADPPYNCDVHNLYLFISNIIKYLESDGLFILEFASKYINNIKNNLESLNLELIKEKNYGTTSLLITQQTKGNKVTKSIK